MVTKHSIERAIKILERMNESSEERFDDLISSMILEVQDIDSKDLDQSVDVEFEVFFKNVLSVIETHIHGSMK